MTKTIIQLAHEAHLHDSDEESLVQYLERFAALHRAAVLEELTRAEMPEPVLYQYRWLNPANNPDDQSSMDWKLVEVRNAYTDTIEGRIQELESYRYQGKVVYEVRALCAADQMREYAAGLVLKEREACAKVCDELKDNALNQHYTGAYRHAAAAIRGSV